MNLAKFEFKLTKHAHGQYCKRVEHVSYAVLRGHVQAAIGAGAYQKRRGKFAVIDGVWWVCKIRADQLILVTCFGRCDFDLPQALRWARRGKDRIRLGGEVTCDVPKNSTP